jgi:nicotinic acid mononucleotide adenylyltransferase
LATVAAMGRSGDAEPGSEAAPEGVLTVSTRRVDVSSTEIRERRRAEKSIKGFVPESVERFIEARGLYR